MTLETSKKTKNELIVTLLNKAGTLEREACQLRDAKQIDKAFAAYDEAAKLYCESGEHLKAALCFSAAATCWNIHTGWQPLHQAASRNHYAADEAFKAADYDYARALYREAAQLYEKEGDCDNYSECFTQSQRAGRKRSWTLCVGQDENVFHDLQGGHSNWMRRAINFFRWFFSLLNDLLWGYGERPLRVLVVAGCFISVCALLYYVSGDLISSGGQGKVSFFDALYFSVITFTTVGYGDYLAIGPMRAVTMIEALLGTTLVPLFLIGMTRRFLRMYR